MSQTPSQSRTLMQSLAAMSCNCVFRLFVAFVQLDPDPEIVGEVCMRVAKHFRPHFRVGLGIRSACGSEDAPEKQAAVSGSGAVVPTWAEALEARANPMSAIVKMNITPRLLFMSAPSR